MYVLVWIRINKTLEAATKTGHTGPEPAPPSISIAPPVAPRVEEAAPTPAPVQKISVPTIKLKIGVNGAAPLPATSSSAKPAPKAKGRKPKEPKLSEVPPPAPATAPERAPTFIDDGSADLLEEVIAIEREQSRKDKERSPVALPDKGKEKQVPKLIIGKRKKPVDDPTEDEILALATPAKKERASVALAGPSNAPSPATNKLTGSAAPSRNGAAPQRSKDKQPSKPSRAPSVEPASAPAARASAKGKEKEVSRQSTPAVAKPTKITSTPMNEKKCREVLRLLTRIPEAVIFLKPVDPVLDGCPTSVIFMYYFHVLS